MSFLKTHAEISGKQRESVAFIDAEVLTLVWKTRPDVIERLLPPGLKPAAEPIAIAFIANYPKTNFGVSYNESALFIRCSYDGEEGNYCLAMPVDNDIAMAGGREIFGFPKKMADFQLNREGDKIKGSVERHGKTFVKFESDLSRPPNNTQEMMKFLTSTSSNPEEIVGLTFNVKSFPSITGEGFDYEPRLIRHETIMKPKVLQVGQGKMTLELSENDPWAEVEVVEMLGAFYTRGNNYMLKGEEVTTINPNDFLPHSFLKWDSELVPC